MVSTTKGAFSNKNVKIFVTTLITIQGLYVFFPLPDIWPFSNYSMFSKANPATVASSFEFYGLTSEGEEELIDCRKAFLPLDKVRLEKGITRILDRESLVQKQEKELESAFKSLSFLPVDNAFLKENVRRFLPYKKNTAVADKEKALHILFDYLLTQYQHNRKKKLHSGPPIVSMNLYLAKWDWTNVSPQKVVPRTRLVYSSEYGVFEDE